MADLQKIKNTSLATIDSALAILHKFPDLSNSNTELSFNTSANPFDFLLDALKSTAGYNYVIKILSNFIIYGVPPLEIAVKTLLLTNIKNMLSCSINPFISDKLLREGIVFNLEQIDLTDTLKYSPTSTKGQYYYFDNKNADGTFMIPDELKKSSDFNCLLWYMKNRASHREVWGKKLNEDGKQFEDNNDYWDSSANNGYGKCRKGAGIITLQFNERSSNLTDAEYNGMSIQTPYNNCLHVFLGNVQKKDNNTIIQNEQDIIKLKKQLNENTKIRLEYIDTLSKYKNENNKLDKQLSENKITQDEYKTKYIVTNEIIDKVINIVNKNVKIKEIWDEYKTQNSSINNIWNELSNHSLIDGDNGIIEKAQSNLTTCENIIKKIAETEINLNSALEAAGYRKSEQNYYHHRTLIEFNTDYVMSLRLFDSKVIAAQLIDNLIGLSDIDLNLTFKQQLIKAEVKKMIEMVIETDSTVVSDCFFTFTNDAYNDMLQKAELNRAKLFSANVEFNGITQINAEDILSKLNDLSDDAVQDGNVYIIEHALNEIAEELSTTIDSKKTQINVGIKFNFIENLLNNLAYVIAASVLSPKVYLLILVNLQIMGQETNFSLEQFIGNFKQMIVGLIRLLRDEILKYVVNELKKILGDIAVEIATKIGVEQAEYYAKLLKKLIECFKRKGGSLDFNVDNVNHADIIGEEVTEKVREC